MMSNKESIETVDYEDIEAEVSIYNTDEDRDSLRMGIDYSPSCPWNAPGMSIRDFI